MDTGVIHQYLDRTRCQKRLQHPLRGIAIGHIEEDRFRRSASSPDIFHHAIGRAPASEAVYDHMEAVIGQLSRDRTTYRSAAARYQRSNHRQNRAAPKSRLNRDSIRCGLIFRLFSLYIKISGFESRTCV